MNDWSIPFLVLVAGLIATTIADWLAAAFWWSWYYTNGVCIFRKTVEVPKNRGIQVLTETLNERFASQHWTSTQYGELCPGDWAIRRAGPWWNPGFFVGIMHGRLLVDPVNGRVTVLGYADWATIWLVLALVGVVIVVQQVFAFIAAFLVIIGILVNYAFRASLYEEVSQFVAYRLAMPIVEQPTRA